MFSTNVEYFCEFWFLHYEKIMRFSPWKIGKYTRWASCWDQYSWVSAIPGNCHLCTEISKRRTIMQATVVFQIFHMENQNKQLQKLRILLSSTFDPKTTKRPFVCQPELESVCLCHLCFFKLDAKFVVSWWLDVLRSKSVQVRGRTAWQVCSLFCMLGLVTRTVCTAAVQQRACIETMAVHAYSGLAPHTWCTDYSLRVHTAF